MTSSIADLYLSLEDLVAPLVERLSSLTALESLFYRYGWEIDLDEAVYARLDQGLAVKASLQQFLSIAGPVRQRLAADAGASVTAQEVAALAGAGAALLQALAAIDLSSLGELPPPLNQRSFWMSIAEHLLDDLLEEYLRTYHPIVYASLYAIGCIRSESIDTGEVAFRRPYTRVVFDWSKVAAFVEDPSASLKDTYRWGDPAHPFDHRRVVHTLDTVAQVIKFPGARVSPSLLPATEPASAPYRIQNTVDGWSTRLSYGYMRQPRAVFDAGIELLPAAKTQEPAPSGLIVRAVVQGGAEGSVPTGRGFSLRWKIAASDGTVGVAVFPDKAQLTGAASTVGASIELARTESGPWYVFGSERTPRLEVRNPSLSFSIEGDAANPEARFRLSAREANGVAGARLVVPLGDADGFVKRTVKQSALELSFSPELIWSSRTGLTFNGKPKVDIELPLDASLGPVRLRRLLFRLAARSGGSRPVIELEASAGMEVAFGPLVASVERLGAVMAFDFAKVQRNLGVVDVALDFKPPTGVGLAVDSPVAQGAGFLFHDPAQHRYGGAALLTIRDRFSLAIAGVLTTKMPDGSDGYSLLLLGILQFPPIPIGFGFSLNQVGVLVGINRTVDVDALSGALAAGDLDVVLFPTNPAALPAVPNALEKLFPAKADAHTIGIIAGFIWGPSALAKIELGIIYDTSAPARLVAIGRLTIERPQIVLHVLALGVLDFDQGELDLQARLFDSRVLGGDLSGGAALMLRWGREQDLVLSIGGFHPAYKPPTAFTRRFAALQRVTLRAHTDESVLRLALQAYLAVTSNTVQMGARVDFGVTVSAFSIDGMVAFDALVQWDPAFYIDVAVRGSVALKIGGTTLVGASVAAQLIGPGDWYVRGTATLSVLWWDINCRFTIGEKPARPVRPAVDGATQLAAALVEPGNWGAQAVEQGGFVTVRRPKAPGGTLVLHPLDELSVRQQIVPLGIEVDRIEAGPLTARRTFDVDLAVGGVTASAIETVREPFARAQFIEMSDAAKLSAPSFEPLPSGVRVSLAASTSAPAVTTTWTYDQFLLTGSGLRASSAQAFAPDATALTHALATSAAADAPLRRSMRARGETPQPVFAPAVLMNGVVL